MSLLFNEFVIQSAHSMTTSQSIVGELVGKLASLANLHWANLIGQTDIGKHALGERSKYLQIVCFTYIDSSNFSLILYVICDCPSGWSGSSCDIAVNTKNSFKSATENQCKH